MEKQESFPRPKYLYSKKEELPHDTGFWYGRSKNGIAIIPRFVYQDEDGNARYVMDGEKLRELEEFDWFGRVPLMIEIKIKKDRNE